MSVSEVSHTLVLTVYRTVKEIPCLFLHRKQYRAAAWPRSPAAIDGGLRSVTKSENMQQIIAKTMVVILLATVAIIYDGVGASGGGSRHAKACRAPARFYTNGCMHACLLGSWVLTEA